MARTLDSKNETVLRDIADYVTVVLDALGVKWGPAHIEVMMSSSPGRGPVLIEANIGRFHGQDVVEVSDRCYGYNSVAVTLDAFLSESSSPDHHESSSEKEDGSSFNGSRFRAITRWRKIPTAPRVLGSSGGRIVHLVSFVDGVRSLHLFEILDVILCCFVVIIILLGNVGAYRAPAKRFEDILLAVLAEVIPCVRW